MWMMNLIGVASHLSDSGDQWCDFDFGIRMQVEYLAQMEKDAVHLEMCTKEIRSQIIHNDFSRSMQQRISRGQDNAVRCTHWYSFQTLCFYWQFAALPS